MLKCAGQNRKTNLKSITRITSCNTIPDLSEKKYRNTNKQLQKKKIVLLNISKFPLQTKKSSVILPHKFQKNALSKWCQLIFAKMPPKLKKAVF